VCRFGRDKGCFAVVAVAILFSLTPALAQQPDNRILESVDPQRATRVKDEERDRSLREIEARNEADKGTACQNQKLFGEAEPHYKKAIALSPDTDGLNNVSRLNLAVCFDETHEFDNALVELDALIALSPRFDEAYRKKVEVLLHATRTSLAVSECEVWASKSKFSPEPLLWRTRALLKGGRSSAASKSALEAYRFSVRHNKCDLLESIALMNEAGVPVPGELPKTSAGNAYVWSTIEDITEIKELPVSGTVNDANSGDIHRLFDKLSEELPEVVCSIGFAENGPSRPGREELILGLSQDLIVISPSDVQHKYSRAILSSEKRESELGIMDLIEQKPLQMTLRIPNGKLWFSFSHEEPPNLQTVHAIWENTKPSQHLMDWRTIREIVKEDLAVKKFNSAAQWITENWSTRESSSDDANTFFGSLKLKKSLLIEAYRGMHKPEIVDYLEIAPYRCIGHDCSELKFYKDLPTGDEFRARRWFARGSSLADGGIDKIECEPYGPIWCKPLSPVLRERLSRFVGTIAKNGMKEIDCPPTDLVNAIELNTLQRTKK
jgi:tetratricopeptide (TPR) repeat protein